MISIEEVKVFLARMLKGAKCTLRSHWDTRMVKLSAYRFILLSIR